MIQSILSSTNSRGTNTEYDDLIDLCSFLNKMKITGDVMKFVIFAPMKEV